MKYGLKGLDKMLSERSKQIKKDKKGYWRLSKGELNSKPFLCYMDLVKIMADAGLEKRDF